MTEALSFAESVLDIVEDSILQYDKSILRLLLMDKSTGKNIIWATSDYKSFGDEYEENSEIRPELITGDHTLLIQPRSAKAKEEQLARTRNKAEVFTPSWVCNKQNNLIDAEWFGKKNVFNCETDTGWETIYEKIDFSVCKKDWKKYVDSQRIEITCGEAPYLVSRYDTVSGETLPVNERIGLFDRKMRVIKENAGSNDEWLTWSIRAVQSVYGYEYQGDNLLLARENLLLSYIDYYKDYFNKNPDLHLLRKIANIIAWNIWQMDGIKYVVPNSCHDIYEKQISFFEEIDSPKPCPGCKNNDPLRHNGTYCKIQDWRKKAPIRFVDLMKGRN